MGEALREVTEDEVARFKRDGVVCLRGVLSGDWLRRMEGAIERALKTKVVDLTEMARSIEGSGGEVLRDESVSPGERRGRFYAGTDHWRDDSGFRAFAMESPLPGLAAALMRSARINLYEDSLLVKEPGTLEATAFHQDLGYFHVEGRQICTTWTPLDVVSKETGAVQYVRGSHLWRREFRPNLFVSSVSIPGTAGEEIPKIDGGEDGYETIHFDTRPGDVVVHHARTLHGASGNRSTSRRRRAISVRYCGDDARYLIRENAPMKPHHHRVAHGELLDCDECPQVWPSERRSG